MNQEQRDAIRAEHHVGQNEADDQCQSCYSPDGYPCYATKYVDLLDACEAEQKAGFTDDELEGIISLARLVAFKHDIKDNEKSASDKAKAMLEARKEAQ
jgi:hypothetical protein